jgi:hypothetical protein
MLKIIFISVVRKMVPEYFPSYRTSGETDLMHWKPELLLPFVWEPVYQTVEIG